MRKACWKEGGQFSQQVKCKLFYVSLHHHDNEYAEEWIFPKYFSYFPVKGLVECYVHTKNCKKYEGYWVED